MSSKRKVFRPAILQSADPNICHIALTQGQIAVVDACDYGWLMQYNWCAHWNEDTQSFYARRGSLKDEGPRHLIGMHSAIMDLPKGFEPDHKDGDTLNNRRGNLRRSTRRQNNYNQDTPSNNTSGFKGVYLNSRGRWIANIVIQGRTKYLGSFATRGEAAEMRQRAAQELHGEFYRGPAYTLAIDLNPKLEDSF